MDRKFSKKILEKCLADESMHGGTMLHSYRDAAGEDQVLESMESFRDIMQTPRAFQETERFLNKELGKKVYESGIGASATSAFSILGVTALVQEAYQQPDNTPLDERILVTPSKTFAEPKQWTAPPDYPKPIADGEAPDLTRILQRGLVQPNIDFGLAFSISRRAIDDDQVGQLANYPAWMGKQHKRQEEAWAAATLTGAAYTEFGFNIPAASYSDPDGTNTVYTTSTGSGGVRRTNAISSAAFTIDSLTDLLNLTKKITDWGGKILFVKPDTIIGGTAVTPKAAQVLNSMFYPGIANTTGAAGTYNSGVMSINPLDPKWKVFRAPMDYEEEPFFASDNYEKAWYLIQSGKAGGIGLVKQDRQALEVMMEAPNAGESFWTRSYNHRTFRRCAWYIADARYVARGNDGRV